MHIALAIVLILAVLLILFFLVLELVVPRAVLLVLLLLLLLLSLLILTLLLLLLLFLVLILIHEQFLLILNEIDLQVILFLNLQNLCIFSSAFCSKDSDLVFISILLGSKFAFLKATASINLIRLS